MALANKARIVTALLFIHAITIVQVASTNVDELRSKIPDKLGEQPPKIIIAILVRNKAHVLPLFLTYLEQQNYPKERIALWIRSDYNSDNSIELLELWLENSAAQYYNVEYVFDNETQRHQSESSPYDWPLARFQHLIELKEEALKYAKSVWADYIFYLDADVLLTAPDALSTLVKMRMPIVAPMLFSEGLYSNFWCGMTPDYYYQRTDEYKEIYNRKKIGVFPVPMVHSAVLINLNFKGCLHYLTFDRKRLIQFQKSRNSRAYAERRNIERIYNGAVDDIIVFAVSANSSGLPLLISNEISFGYILQPLEAGDELNGDFQQLINIRTIIINDLGAVTPLLNYFQSSFSYPRKDTLSLDRIYMINLRRRPERRKKMELLFDELGLEVTYFPAVDGKELDVDIVQQMDIKFLPGYEDPYYHRPMTMGEIGCFLSHYYIWKLMLDDNDLNEVLILEDDIRFEPYFKENALRVLQQARSVVEFDLIYFGRKRLKDEIEISVLNAEDLVHVGYSYWTLGYVISVQGARKLLDAKPLEKLLPVDEFLPIMFDKHPNKTWAAAYPQRDLIAFSASPLLLYPTHYTGEEGYISDTEDSEQIKPVRSDQQIGDGDAQLKSDREKIYTTDEEQLQLTDFKLDGTKTHEEL